MVPTGAGLKSTKLYIYISKAKVTSASCNSFDTSLSFLQEKIVLEAERRKLASVPQMQMPGAWFDTGPCSPEGAIGCAQQGPHYYKCACKAGRVGDNCQYGKSFLLF